MQARLKRPVSDHTPILLCCNSGLNYKAPFRLDNYLLHHPDFLPNLKVWWQNLTFTGRPSFVFVKKLQGLKFFIKAWRKTFGDLQLKIDHLEDVINSWDLQEEADIVLSTAEVVAREEAKAKHAALTLDVARKWGQRAKEDWARNAEKNSKYLHQISDNFDEGCKC